MRFANVAPGILIACGNYFLLDGQTFPRLMGVPAGVGLHSAGMAGRCNFIHELALIVHLFFQVGLLSLLLELFQSFAFLHGFNQLPAFAPDLFFSLLHPLTLLFDIPGQLLDIVDIQQAVGNRTTDRLLLMQGVYMLLLLPLFAVQSVLLKGQFSTGIRQLLLQQFFLMLAMVEKGLELEEIHKGCRVQGSRFRVLGSGFRIREKVHQAAPCCP